MKRKCQAIGCGQPHGAKGWCHRCYKRVIRNGDPSIVIKPPKGEDHHCWKAGDISYSQAHKRVYRAKGKAGDHFCGCGEPAREWAYDGLDPNERTQLVTYGTSQFMAAYSDNPEHYRPLCKSCHNSFDGRERVS